MPTLELLTAESPAAIIVDAALATLSPEMSTARNFPGRIIEVGMFDDPIVLTVQKQLNALGYGPLTEDGDFGVATEIAVKLFQSQSSTSAGESLEVDGQVGRETWAVLFEIGGSTEQALDPSGDFVDLAISVATSQIGIRESPLGSNRGPQVDEYVRAAGLNPAGGFAWCVCFLQWVFREAAEARGMPSPLPKTAGVHVLWQKSKGHANTVVPANKASASTVSPGMIFMLDAGGGKGHAGLVVGINGNKIITVEGNTNADGGREGNGVFRRTTRKIKMASLLGYADYTG